MTQVMYPARNGPGGVPLIRYGLYEDAAPIVIGSVLIFDTGQYDIAGANPALIAGVALQAADTAPGYQAANNPVPITGRERKIAVAVADKNTTLWATLTNGSAVRIAGVTADIGAQYGITAYSGVWTVDKAKTAGDARVQIVDIDTERGGVFFKWLTDHIYGAA
jgi:hypothetical protein